MRLNSALHLVAILAILTAVADCGKKNRRAKPAQLPKPRAVVVDLVYGSPVEIETIPLPPKKLFKQLAKAIESNSEVRTLKLIHGNDVARQAIIDNMHMLPQTATAPMAQLVWAIAGTEWCEYLVDRLASNGALSLLLVTGKTACNECRPAYATALHAAMPGLTNSVLDELQWPLSNHIPTAVRALLSAGLLESAQRLTEFTARNLNQSRLRLFMFDVYELPLDFSFLANGEILKCLGSTSALSFFSGAINYMRHNPQLLQVAVDTLQSVGKGPYYGNEVGDNPGGDDTRSAAERAVEYYIAQKRVVNAAMVCSMFGHLDPKQLFKGAPVTLKDVEIAAITTVQVACNRAQSQLYYHNPVKILLDASEFDPTELHCWNTYRHFAGDPSTWAAGHASHDQLAQ